MSNNGAIARRVTCRKDYKPHIPAAGRRTGRHTSAGCARAGPRGPRAAASGEVGGEIGRGVVSTRGHVRAVAAAFAVVGTMLAVVPADGADFAPRSDSQSKVAIQRIPPRVVPYDEHTVAIRPRVTKSGHIQIRSQRITVSRAGKTLVRNVRAAHAKPGTYRVLTTVTYRPFKLINTGRSKTKQVLAAGPGMAAVPVHCTYTYVAYEDTPIMYGSNDHLPPDYANLILTCTSTAYDGSWSASGFFHLSDTDNLWHPEAPASLQSQMPTTSDPLMLTGTSFDTNAAPGEAMFKTESVPVTKRRYGRTRTLSRSQALKVTQERAPYVNSRGCATRSDYDLVIVRDTHRSRADQILGSHGTQYGSLQWVDLDGNGVPRYLVERTIYRTCDPADELVLWIGRSTRDPASPDDMVMYKSYADH
jgi:hypothetical protein